MGWQPRVPLVLCETVVDFSAHDTEIEMFRYRVETSARHTLKRIASSLAATGHPSLPMTARLETQIVRELDRVVLFGYKHAQTEIAAMRSASFSSDLKRKSALARRGTPRAVPDAGQYGHIAAEGLPAIHRLVRHRGRRAAQAIITAAATVKTQLEADAEATVATAAILVAASKELHRNVIELVGEALNLGRTAGALRYPDTRGGPPAFAMRSEQLDKRTCSACESLHGTITRVGTGDYFAYLPPTGCFGGGRCRALMVFADGPDDVRGPDTEPGPQPPLPELGPSL